MKFWNWNNNVKDKIKADTWNMNAPVKKVENLLFFGIKVTVKVTKSLALVSFERVSLVEYACQSLYLLRFKSYGHG